MSLSIKKQVHVDIPVVDIDDDGHRVTRRQRVLCQPEFTLAVDFAGSARNMLCDSLACRTDDPDNLRTGAGDCNHKYTAKSLRKELRGKDADKMNAEENQNAVANSFWSLLGEGRPPGLRPWCSQELRMCPSWTREKFPSTQMIRLLTSVACIKAPSFAWNIWSLPAEVHLDPGKGVTARVVIAASAQHVHLVQVVLANYACGLPFQAVSCIRRSYQRFPCNSTSSVQLCRTCHVLSMFSHA